MNIWDNPQNYIRCSKKLYEIYACMPPAGTVVINILEQAHVVQMLGGRTYFTAQEVLDEKVKNSTLFNQLQQLAQQGLVYTVNDNQNVVLAGTMGEMWTMNFNKFISRYTNTDGSSISISQLRHWHKAKTVKDTSYAFACPVPANIQGQIATSWGTVLNINGVGVQHGYGDFVIAGNGVGGNPDFSDRYVVNGIVFGRTYNNNGFTKYLQPEQAGWNGISKDQLPKLCISVNKPKVDEKHKEFFNHYRHYAEKFASCMMGYYSALNNTTIENKVLEETKHSYEHTSKETMWDETLFTCKFKTSNNHLVVIEFYFMSEYTLGSYGDDRVHFACYISDNMNRTAKIARICDRGGLHSPRLSIVTQDSLQNLVREMCGVGIKPKEKEDKPSNFLNKLFKR